MSLFNTDFIKQVNDFLPPVVRSNSLIEYLFSLSVPLESRLKSDVAFETEISDEVRYNGQKMVLQGGINAIMGVTIAPFILIETRRTFLGIAPVIFNESEAFETAVVGNETEDTMIVINNSEETIGEKDFKVRIPVSLSTPSFDEKVNAKVTLIKAAGVSFTTETYV